MRRQELLTSLHLDQVQSAIVTAVEDVINYQGFLVVTSEIGAGKTILNSAIVGSAGGRRS